jgi:hypothetical protein
MSRNENGKIIFTTEGRKSLKRVYSTNRIIQSRSLHRGIPLHVTTKSETLKR